MPAYHLAEVNIASPLAPLDDPVMAGFVDNLSAMNALAEATPGFVWRLTDDTEADATSLRPYGADVMVNMSVWESVEALREYTYRTAHLDFMRRRHEWFRRDGPSPHLALWWVPAGHRPGVEEAGRRLAMLAAEGPGLEAFTLRRPFPPPTGPDLGTGSAGSGRGGALVGRDVPDQ